MRPAPPRFTVPSGRCHFTLLLDGRGVRLHAMHKDQAAAFAAFRVLEGRGIPCVAVRLDNDYGRPLTILRACGVNPDALEADPDFRAAAIRACIRPGG